VVEFNSALDEPTVVTSSQDPKFLLKENKTVEMLFYVDVNYLDDEYKVDSDLSSGSEDEDGKKADEEERKEREDRQKVIDKAFPDHKKEGSEHKNEK